MELPNTKTKICTLLFLLSFQVISIVFAFPTFPDSPTSSGQLGQNPQAEPPCPPQNPDLPEPGQILHSEMKEFLDAHNKVRAHVGEPLFVWNKTLASYTLSWAKKRIADCRMIHSYGPYGENIFWGGRDHWTSADAVKAWMKEHWFYDRRTNACLPGRLCGH